LIIKRLFDVGKWMKHTLELKEISETESVCKYINILNLEQEHVFAKLLI